MFPWSGVTTFNIIQFMSGEGAEYFNYFFTLMVVCGLLFWGIGLLLKIISRS
jgi:hypothetical protein